MLEPGGEAFVGAGRVEAVLAGSAGLVRAVRAGRRAVPLVVGGLIERGQDDGHPGASDRLRVLADGGPGLRRAGVAGFGRLREVRADRCFLGAFVDAGQVADESDGAAGVLVIAAAVAVLFQDVQDVDDQAPGLPRRRSCAQSHLSPRAAGWMSAAMLVPRAGRHP